MNIFFIVIILHPIITCNECIVILINKYKGIQNRLIT